MLSSRVRRRGFWLLVAAVFAVGAAGMAYAAIPDEGGVIHGCYAKKNGRLRVIDQAEASCRAAETPISWGGGAAAITYHYRVGAMLEGGGVAQALCLPGEKVTGGGGISVAFPNDVGLTQNFPIADESGLIAWDTNAIGWQVGTEGFGPVQAFVVCAS